MADDKSGRDKQARDEERRQREREMNTAVERGDEPEPAVDTSELAYFETGLEPLTFPATGAEIVSAVGDREIESTVGTYAVADLLPAVDWERFDSPEEVRVRIRRPTIAAAMKRVVEASDRLPNEELDRSQRDAYERTFEALKAIDADDEDEGIRVVADWIVERIGEKETIPGSRDVRRRAAEFCRTNGYEIRNDEWLGV
ncbi:hypothetical protein U4E84_14785 [Halorubrum sp. AD140]|uniref:DUF5789 family protein n=1 Tax=Halorubrum sp. AD140 TaxID=3050073 RepID=UPI002ACC39FF|nr:hypothetical protein [Halorubrum sp. AD140]MDZ5812612.1 hypothetical protein [Halorubrum sp. AD140]